LEQQPTTTSRRAFLKAMAGAAGVLVLAACGGSPSPSEGNSAQAPTAEPAAAAGATAAPAPAAAPTAAPAATPTAAAAVSDRVLVSPQIDTTGIKKGGTIIRGDVTDVRTLNPLLVSDTASGEVTSLMFDGLVDIDPDSLDPIPNLAVKWDVSADNKTYTFTLKDGVKWHDGQPFTANDAKFSYDLYMNPDTGTPRAGTLKDRIASVEAKDPTTLVITLKAVVAPFLVSDCGYGLLPQHLLKDVKPADIPTNEFTTAKPIGTGSFKFKEFKTGDHVTLVANPDYHRGAPALDTYIRKFVKDDTTLYQQLKTGEVDAAPVPVTFYDDAKGQTNFKLFPYDTFSFQFFGYNLDTKTGSPIFQDQKVRQALFYAVDRPGIVEKIREGLSTVASGTMPVLSWAYQPDKITSKYEFDPAKAEQLLDEAGWAKGADGVRAKDGKPLAFDMYTYSGDKIIEGYASVFQENWKAIGVTMTPKYEEFSTFVTRLTKTFDFQAFLVGFFWNVDPDQQTMWDTKQHGPGFNLYNYSNPKVDDLLEKALRTLDKDQRKQLYLDAQNLILADAPALIIDFPKEIWGVSNRLKNFIPNAVSFAATWNSYQWFVTDGK
jgi:peptide/nickel transport system substrate-binding protein